MIGLNSAWNFANFRGGLIRALLDAGYEVVAVAPPDEHVDRVRQLGCRFIPLPMDARGKHPVRDLLLLLRLWRLMRSERPDVYLGYTIKPNIYGSIAARTLGIPTINNITGLGATFSHDGVIAKTVRGLYGIALKQSRKVFFQNDQDMQLFVEAGLVAQSAAGRLPGSGIDVDRFAVTPLPGRAPLRFLLIARLLWEKGVLQYVEAARLLHARGVAARFELLGFLDEGNSAAVSVKDVSAWQAEGVVNYLGVSHDVRREISQVDCVVLPTFYREGTPRALLEAAAMGRPIVTTNSIGCADVVDDGVTGYLCRPRDAEDLAQKMYQVVAMSAEERAEMGRRGRLKIEREFNERIVVDKYLNAIREVLK